MNIRPSEYGQRGVLGIGTPQANPTVEQDLWLLRPAQVSLVTARLVSTSSDPKTRLTEYLVELGTTLQRFDQLALDAFGFACTASSYILGHAAELVKLDQLRQQFSYPVVSAAAAIEAALKQAGAERIAFVAPYPAWLGELGRAYWQSRDFEVVSIGLAALPNTDTRNIYRLGSEAASEQLRGLDPDSVDAVVFSGTGMPSLRAVLRAREQQAVTALSSNLCLAWALSRQLGIGASDLRPADLLAAQQAAIASL